MRTQLRLFVFISSVALIAPTGTDAATKSPSTTNWTRALEQRAARGTLADRRELVRGDTGKWNDAARIQLAPPLERKPPGRSLDDWGADTNVVRAIKPTVTNDFSVIFRSRQLDDNDRVWVERIERQGNEFVITMNEAVWQGWYQKTFTYYQVLGVNLGKLGPGSYSVKWRIQPLDFKRFEDPGQPRDNWPKDEAPARRKPVELSLSFVMVAPR